MPFAKWTLYDCGMRNQLICRWPGRIAAGAVTDAMVQYCDLIPTWTEAAGGIPPEDLDGYSFLDVLEGHETAARETVFGVHTTVGINNGKPYPIRAARDHRFKLLWNLMSRTDFSNNLTVLDRKWFFFNSWRAIRDTNEHAVFLVERYIHRAEFELYDTHADPCELNNLANAP
jgi:N-sulfoglucosamine sulfohydrolase